jgi:hypothetical protein
MPRAGNHPQRREAVHREGEAWYCVLRTPRQQIMFNGAVGETVRDLIGCAAIAARNI